MRSEDFVEYNKNGFKGHVAREFASKPFLAFLDDIDKNVEAAVENHYKDYDKPTDRMVTVIEVPMIGGPTKVILKQDDFNRDFKLGKSAKFAFKVSRGKHGFEAACLMIEGGLLTPAPIAYIEKRSFGVFKKGYFFMEYIDGSEHLAERLKKTDDWVRLIVMAGDTIRLLHDINCTHRDMKTSNFLVKDDGDRSRIYLIDTEDVKFHKKIDKMSRMKDLLRFVRSIPRVRDEDMDMLLSGYGKHIKSIRENITPKELRQFYYKKSK